VGPESSIIGQRKGWWGTREETIATETGRKKEGVETIIPEKGKSRKKLGTNKLRGGGKGIYDWVSLNIKISDDGEKKTKES